MWVRKQDPAAQGQEFATPAAALRHVKLEGAPSTLQQVQIERSAKNGKPRNGFEFSLKPPASASPQQSPKPPTAATPSTTQGLTNFIQVLGSSYCSSCRGQLCGITSSCSQCKRGVHEHCFLTLEGEANSDRWCFACACKGCAKPLGDSDTQQCKQCKCYVNVGCVRNGSCLQCAKPICPPCPPAPKVRAFHSSWQSGRLWLRYENGVMFCAACRAFPHLAAQPGWIAGIKNIKWYKVATTTWVHGTFPSPRYPLHPRQCLGKPT